MAEGGAELRSTCCKVGPLHSTTLSPLGYLPSAADLGGLVPDLGRSQWGTGVLPQSQGCGADGLVGGRTGRAGLQTMRYVSN